MKKQYSLFLPLVIFLVIIVFAFGQSTQFALWQDDNALIFKLQHLEEQVGVFGPGTSGLGAYRYIALPYIPIYQIFRMNISTFYLYALVFYFLAAGSVFLLAKYLTKNNLLPLLSGAIFSAGFIGSDGILRLFNSVQTSYSIFFVCLFFFLLWRFVQKMNNLDYLAALFLFFISLETAFIRTQYLIFPTAVFLILFLKWGKPQNWKMNLFFIIPFLLIYKFVFSYSIDARVGLVKDYVNGILAGKFDYLHSFFGTLGNIVLPQPLQVFLFDQIKVFSLDYTNRLLILELIFLFASVFLINVILKTNKIFVRILLSILPVIWFIFGLAYFQNSEFIFVHSLDFDTLGVFSNFLGGLFLILQIAIIWILLKYKKEIAKITIFLLSWVLANILAYSTYLPFTPLESINRYLTHSLTGYAILIPVSLYFLNKRAAIFVSAAIILSNVAFSIIYQNQFIEERSTPTAKFYSQLKEYLPEISRGSVLYFDVAEDKKSQQEFKDFFSVGSMPDTTAIAVRYGIDRYDFSMTSDFREFLSLIGDKQTDNAFSFFYGQEGLKDTTNLMRSNLDRGGSSEGSDSSLVTPAILTFRARAIPDFSVVPACVDKLSNTQRKLFFDYLVQRDKFLSKVKVKALSQEKYRDAVFLVDGDRETLWRGNRGHWSNNQHEEISLDLGSVAKIGQIVWVNGYANSTPIDYSIEVSKDGKVWEEVKNVVGGSKKQNGLVVEDNFPAKQARYVRFIINKTFDNDSPAISEIEAVEDSFVSVSKEDIKTAESTLICAGNQAEFNVLKSFIKSNGLVGKILYKTDKSPVNSVSFSFIGGNNFHNYSVFLPQGGTKIADLKIDGEWIPAQISVSRILIHYPDKKELIKISPLQTSQ